MRTHQPVNIIQELRNTYICFRRNSVDENIAIGKVSVPSERTAKMSEF